MDGASLPDDDQVRAGPLGVAAIAGDAAADDVRLVLPETGVCTTQFGDTDGAAASGCRGGPVPAEAHGCCVADMTAKAHGRCGCGAGAKSRHVAA